MWTGMEMSCLLSDILGTDEDVIYRDMETEAEIRELLSHAMGKLSKREQMIVSNCGLGLNTRDGEEKTQKEVADLLGISQSYISTAGENVSSKRLRREIVRLE